MGQLNLGNGANFVGGTGGELADAPKGTILQYVEVAQSVISSRFTTSSTSYVASGYEVDIAAKQANSLIVIQGSLSMSVQNNQSYGYIRCYKDGVSSDLYEAGFGTNTPSNMNFWAQPPFKFVYTPGDTNSHEYKLYLRVYGSATLYCGWSSNAGSTRNWNHMCAIEIAQ